MMNTKLPKIALGMAAFLLTAAAAVAADFSADMVSSTPQGSMTAKIYVSGEKSRVEMAGMITISRMDKSVTWMLMPQQKMYMEHAIDMRSAMSTQEKVKGELTRTVEGTETVSGVNTTKYRVTYEANGRRDEIFQWIDNANHFPVKTASVDGSWSSEFKNIDTKTQDPELFEIPAGYSKMSAVSRGIDGI